jgi:4-carboxymuconolactone decarboxylase
LDEMVRKRGYVLDYHKVLTNCDLDLMKASAALVEAAYLNERKLDRRTKD